MYGNSNFCCWHIDILYFRRTRMASGEHQRTCKISNNEYNAARVMSFMWRFQCIIICRNALKCISSNWKISTKLFFTDKLRLSDNMNFDTVKCDAFCSHFTVPSEVVTRIQIAIFNHLLLRRSTDSFFHYAFRILSKIGFRLGNWLGKYSFWTSQVQSLQLQMQKRPIKIPH